MTNYIKRALATALLLFVPAGATLAFSSNPQCDWLIERVHQHQQQAASPEVHEQVLRLILLAQACLAEGSPDVPRQIWLLESEIYAYDALGRFEEARQRLNLFFDRYARQSDAPTRARMYASLFRVQSLLGDLMAASITFNEGRALLAQVGQPERFYMDLNAAGIYMKLEAFAMAHNLVTQVESQLDQVVGDSLRTRLAALVKVHRGAISLYEQAGELQPNRTIVTDVAISLFDAAETFERMGDKEYYTSTMADYAKALGLLGESRMALEMLDIAINQAKEHSIQHVWIYGLYRRGVEQFKRGEVGAAEKDLSEAIALMDETGLREYELVALEALGSVYEAQEAMQQARVTYNRALAEAQQSQERDALLAARRAQAGLIRTTFDTQTKDAFGWSDRAWPALLAALVGLILGFNLRRRRPVDDGSPHVVPPLEAGHPSVPTLPQPILPHLMRPPVPRTDPPSLFDRRLMYIYTVLIDPQAVLPHTDDPYIIGRIRNNDVQLRSVLYACAAILETAEEGTTFDNDPANTIGSYLRKWFKKFNLVYPAHVPGWIAFFSRQEGPS